jgi:hypothetical protein
LNRFVRKSIRVILWVIISIILLLILPLILIQVPYVQNLGKDKVVRFLEDKLGTAVSIGKLSIDFPKRLVLEDIYFEDQAGDTLLSGDTIKVDITMWKLLSNQVVINEIDLRGMTGYIHRTLPDSAYNFDYIIKAFIREEERDVPLDSAAAMRFSVSKINLDRIRFKMEDEVAGTDMYAYLRHFDTDIKDFDYENRKFRIPRITLSGLNATFLQAKALSRKSLTTDTLDLAHPFTYPDVELDEIDIEDIQIDYKNTVTAIDSKLDLGDLNIQFDALDLPNQKIDVSSISLEHTSGHFALGEAAQEAVESTAEEVAEVMEVGWTVNVSKLRLDSIDFKYDDLTKDSISRGLDYSHLDLQDVMADASDIFYNTDTLSGKVHQLKVSESSGLELKNLKGDFFYGQKEAWIDNFVVETEHSFIRDRVRFTYPSIDSIAKDMGEIGLEAHFTGSDLAVSDLLLFAPSLANKAPFKGNHNDIIQIDGTVSGHIDDLRFTRLELTGPGDVHLRGSGRITGLPDVNRSYFDLNIGQLYIGGSDVKGMIPAGSMPSNIRIPDFVSMQGTFKGTLASFQTNMDLNSSYGTAHINGTVKNINRKGRESYNVRIRTHQFDAGKLIMQEEKIGKVSLAASISGTGTDPGTANAKFDAQIDEVQYQGYTYHHIVAKGSANQGMIDVEGSISDPNITLDLDGTANLNGQYPQLDIIMDIDTLNLQKLYLSEKDLRIRGRIIADLETADPDYLNGTIDIADLNIGLDGQNYRTDTVHIASVATEGRDSLDLHSEFLTLHLAGQYNLPDILPALQSTVNQYFNTIPGIDTVLRHEPQQIEFTLNLIRSPLLEEIMPDLESMEDASLAGNFDSSTGELQITGSIPGLRYKKYTFHNLGLDIHTEKKALNYAVTLDRISSKQFQVANASLTGKAQDDILDVNLQVKDAEEKDQYRIAGQLTSSDDHFKFSLLPEGLILNEDPWTVTPDNTIQFGEAGLMVTNFKISHEDQSLSIHSNPQQSDAPWEVQFTDFRIETLARLVTKDSLFAGGVINGEANVRDIRTNIVFTSDLTIEDFSFHGDTVGNIALQVNNEKVDTYAADMKITGDGNEVNLNGYYYAGEQNNFDLNMDIAHLNLSSVEGFTSGYLDDASGNISGDLSIKGTLDDPAVRGAIRFHDTRFRISKFNSYFRAPDETIRFTEEGVQLDDFTLIDSTGNEALLTGMVFTDNYRDYAFDMEILADDFQVLNSTRQDNELYYGQLFIDAHLHIEGELNSPVADGSLRVNDRTVLTIVVPQEDPGLIEREGIVEFIDMDTFQYTILTTGADSLNQIDWTGLDVAVSISIDEDAELNLIIDEANGDYLNVKGVADLTGGIDPSGKMTLTGRYELHEGSYSFSFNQLKREFLIEKGSTILWTGDALNADVDVAAVYTAETAPLSLVQHQLAEADQSVINTYKQKLPFRILLSMKGKLLKPDIAFDIELPERNYGVSGEIVTTVQARLAELRTEPSELNKQVFAVLLLNRFISDDPFQNDARGGGISSLARQSASRLLSEQLNNLMGGLIAGVELSFDINSIEDYTTGELQNRTELTVGLSKQLLDDRLKVSVGSQFELEGPQDADRKTTNIAGDVSAEYQLSKDGRFLLRAYRKDEYIIVQGQVIETGIGFVFTADYEKFRDLFAKKTEEQKFLKKAERQARKAERKEE